MHIVELVALALKEDTGPGDVTTMACVPADARGEARIVAKQDLVVSGHVAASAALDAAARSVDASVDYQPVVMDGGRASVGDVIAVIEGSLRGILIGERLALNYLMRLSGIATHVASYVKVAEGTGLRVVDTRKTTPLLRALEKAAVRDGGAHNHRYGLYDGVMVKDNHIRAAGGIATAVARARASAHHLLRIEVEVTNLEELDQALAAEVDVVLLDNMNDEMLARCVTRARAVRPEVVLEASGNMTPQRIAGLGGLGLDVVSAGGLIHQATWVDLSMKVQR